MVANNLKKHGKQVKRMLHKSIHQALNQVINIVNSLQDLTQTKHDYLYNELNIGNHIRHINDHFFALMEGSRIGIIDYNTRNRGSAIETDSNIAIQQVNQILDWIEVSENSHTKDDLNKAIKIISEIDCIQTQSMEFSSNIARELLYLINHTIHHTAHIGLIAKNNGIEIPLDVGMAPCTMTFLRTSNS